jgi:flavin-dependent dehydrogenase
MTRTDVCVIGGGPAGAAVACRLARLGHGVTVVERHSFPRPHVGESVSPGVWPLLETLGARERIESAAFTKADVAHVRWGGPAERRAPQPGGGLALTVDRGRFDELLLAAARDAGATVVQPAVARQPRRAGGGWEVPLAGGGVIRAAFLADASGRRRLLGGRRKRTAPALLALHGSWRGVRHDGSDTRVDACRDGWLWGAHVPSGSFRAMAFVDPALVRMRRSDGHDGVYHELLGESPLFADLVAGAARLEGSVHACDATCYFDAAPITGDSAKVGEAAFAIDPLSSSGVQTAIQSAIAASTAVHTILTADADGRALASAYYREHQRYAVEHHQRLAAESYADCVEHRDEPFWSARAGRRRRPDAPAPAAAGLDDLMARPVRLCSGAVLVATPCAVGERVERRLALRHASLPRPVAYLGDAELAPLLETLRRERPLRSVLDEWSRVVAPERAHGIAGWLAHRGLLEAADGAPR